jgi:hypothetical protein
MNGCDMLLVKIAGQRLDEDQVRQLRQELIGGCADLMVDAYAAVDHEETYLYCRVDASAPAQALDGVRAQAAECYPDAQISPHERVCDLPGASHGQPAPWHYIVETDVVAEADQDLNDWYDQEHMPGLASVPGTVRAERFVCHGGSPRYHACYDLVTRETFGCAAWLAVRASSWSDRVRPSFRNSKRTMFRKIG